MTPLSQLPAATQALAPADTFPVDQTIAGVLTTTKATFTQLVTLLATLLPAPTPGSKIYWGTGAPASNLGNANDGYVDLATGNTWLNASGTWGQTGSLRGPQGIQGLPLTITGMAQVATIYAADLVGISQGGADHAITLSNFIDGETIDQLTAASAVADNDTFMTGQGGGSTLTKQTAAALAAYLFLKLPGYKPPVQELTASATLDATYNGKILVISAAGVTLNPSPTLMGNGFKADVVVVGSGSVVFGSGFITSTGGTTLAAPGHAGIYGITYGSGTTIAFADMGGGASAPVAAPGQIAGLTLGTVTSSTLAFTWTAPTTGGAATYYQVQYRTPVGSGAWTSVSINPSTTSVTISGLSASTQYDVQVAANNSGGVASSYVVYGQSPAATTASAGSAPGVPSGLTTGSVTSASVALTWTAPSTGGAPTGYMVEYSTDSGSTWSAPVSFGNVTSGTVSGLTASTSYAFRIAAFNVSGSSAYAPTSSYPTATTSAAGTTYTMSWNTAPASTQVHGATAPVNCHVNPAPGSTVGVNFYYSTSATTNTMTATWTARGSDGYPVFTDVWGAYMTAPATPGTYYVWAVVQDGTGTLVSSAITVT